MTLLLGLLLFLPKILAGFAVAHLLWRDFDIPAILLKISIGIPLGFALSASLFFLSVLAGISPQTYSWIELWIVLPLDVLFLIRFIRSAKDSTYFSKPAWPDIAGAAVVFAGAFLFIVAFLFYSRQHRYGFEDAWTMWNFTARFIFRENSAAILTNSPFYARFHPDYPVDLGLNVAWGWFILKKEASDIPIAISLLSAFAFGGVFWGTLRKSKGVVAATIGALLSFVAINVPPIIGQYADPLFSLHILSAAALFYGFLKTREPGMLALSGLLAGSSAWVKNEGILFTGVLSAVCLFAAWRQVLPWRALKLLLAALIGPLVIVLLYKSVVEWHNDLFSGTTSFYAQLLDLSRWLLIGKNFIVQTMNYVRSPISIVIILAVYVLLIGFDRKEARNQILLFLIFAGQFAGYFFIYLITPHNLQVHIATSIERLVSHLFPLALLWILVALQSPELAIHTQTGAVDSAP